jgi:hypothetical protein
MQNETVGTIFLVPAANENQFGGCLQELPSRFSQSTSSLQPAAERAASISVKQPC